MGDDFVAMNRARREGVGSPGSAPTPSSTPAPASGDEAVPAAPEQGALGPLGSDGPSSTPETAGALPLDQVAPTGQDEPAPGQRVQLSAPPVYSRGMVAAQEKARASKLDPYSTHAASITANAPVGHDPRLNGYSAEVVVHHDRGSIVTEQYRAVRTQILAKARTRRIQTYVVTSSAPEEGKTVTTINLGIAFAELRNQRTLLMECDLRRPSFEKLLARKCDVGLLQLLRGEISDIDKALQPTVYDNLQFLPAGGREAQHSTELLSSPRMAQLLDRLKDRYDHIFIDTPPVVTVTDACILGATGEGTQTVLVVRLNKTPSDVVDRAKRLLRAANCEVAGVVLTHMSQGPLKYLYRYPYYGRYYTKG